MGPELKSRVALVMRAAGLSLIVTSLAAAGWRSGGAQALAQVMPVPGLGTPVPDSTSSPSPAPLTVGPRPIPASKPAPRTGIRRGGPLTFSLSGNLSFGERAYSSVRGDPSSSAGLTSASQAQATNNLGLLLQVARRTGATTLTMGMPLGVSSSQRANFGQIQAGYYTPHYGLQYMPQPVSVLGGIPAGSTLGGLSFIFPLRGGDVSFYQGSGTIDQNAGAHIYGVRARTLLGRNLVEMGYAQATRTDGTGRVDTVIAGFAGANGNLNEIFEGALQRRHDASGGAGNANAYQYRLDYGSQAVYSTFSLKHISNGFTSVGNGTINADDQLAAGFRTGALSFQEMFDRAGFGDQLTRSREGTLSYQRAFGSRLPIQTMWTISEQRSENTFGAVWLGSAGAQFATSFRDVSTLLTAQSTRSTSSAGAPLSSFTYQTLLQKPFGQYLAQAQYQSTRQLSGADSSKVGQANVSVTRDFGRTALTVSDTFTRTQTTNSDALQTAPLLTVAQRLSSALTLAVSYGLQTTRDTLNPSSNGRSRLFNVQLTAPFAIGSGLVQGRVDPRLPATISGSVMNDTADQGPFTTAVSNGVGNVMVVLDSTQVQRTDLSGRFQFNFVTPGHHTVQLEFSSLPRGVTPDQPVASIDVQGGQQGQVFFRIGTYGGVQGKVLGRDANGQLVPVAGVVLLIDKSAGVSTTSAEGLYGFGRLPAGTHAVSIQTASLPASLALPDAMLSQKVTVRNGEITTLDFIGSALASIAGKVVYDQSLAPQHTGGVMNAYVVAEPGDYAAITNDDGSFLLDNVPPGTYSLDVDPETVPPDTGNTGGAQSITVKPDDHLGGLQFVIGQKQKSVVFTFKSAQTATATMSLQEAVLPPGGATEIAVDAGEEARAVTVTAFEKTFALTYDKRRTKWTGTLAVPLDAPPGTSTILADVNAPQKTSASADLKIDPAMPIATFSMTPRRPMRGQYVQVRARFLADVHPGDTIRWNDGQITKLTKPIAGRVYEFTVKISVQPMPGLLLTRQARVPITLR